MSLFDNDPIGDPDRPSAKPEAHEPTKVTWREALFAKKDSSRSAPPKDGYENLGLLGQGMRARAEQREAKAEAEKKIVCPHCQTAGQVTTVMVKKKHGISGGKATGAILTGGVSLLATGLARKGWVTKLHCANCLMDWEVG